MSELVALLFVDGISEAAARAPTPFAMTSL